MFGEHLSRYLAPSSGCRLARRCAACTVGAPNLPAKARRRLGLVRASQVEIHVVLRLIRAVDPDTWAFHTCAVAVSGQ